MSCPCPSGYTPTIDSDACIYTITAATSGGTFFYTATGITPNGLYSFLGTIFYEDVTNLTLPIQMSGSTGSFTTENGTPLNNTAFMVDGTGRILNMLVGGPGSGVLMSGTYGPPSLQNSLWGDGMSGGRLNNAGIWTTEPPITGTSQPVNEWVGVSYCLDLLSGGTYLIGFAGDDTVRVRVNGNLIFDGSIFPSPTAAYFTYSPTLLNYHIFPYTFTSGLNIIEIEGLSSVGPAGFVSEIYSGLVSTLSGYTSYSQLSADTLFSTLNFVGQDILLSESGATTNTGYTCPSGYSLYTCSGSPYCVLIDKTDIVNYCINDTGLGYDDNYKYGGIHNSQPYWSGVNIGNVIYFTTGGTWCMSSVLDGTCLLEGPYPCISTCPDLCDEYVFSGTCPTPTPTPTVNCSVLDFNAIFDCEVTPTPSITPTISTTPTMTPTPSISEPCGGRAVDVTISGYTPTPTPTPSITPSSTPQITRPCSVSGNVVFNTVLGLIECPSSKKFIDCENGNLYYASNTLPLPSGGTLSQLSVFKANVDGISRCITYVGIDLTINGMNIIELVDGPLDFDADCSVCVPSVTQTPTPTPTPSITPTITPTPTASALVGYYLFQRCNTNSYVIQTLPGPTSVINQVFSLTDYPYSNECWKYISYSSSYPSLPLGSTSSFLSGNSFQSLGVFYYSDCSECIAIVGDSGEL
jgi:hypothetical protein